MPDQNTILHNQYANASNLNARIELHLRFSTNSYGWFEWVLDKMALPASSRILEVGCGPGKLWSTNYSRLSKGWQLVLSDFSYGMVAQAESALEDARSHFTYTQADVNALPFPSNSFDILIANHMLYHVPDKHRALDEFRRVLKDDGQLFASTIGLGHMKELHDLEEQFDPSLERIDMGTPTFNLENGRRQLEEQFSNIHLERYEDNLVVTDAVLLADYVLSTASKPVASEKYAQLIEFFKEQIKERGSIFITKASGMFIAKV